MFGAISEKLRTFDMQIIFAIPPPSNFSLFSVIGGIFFPFQSYESSITLSINSLEKSKVFRHFPTVPNLYSSFQCI